MPVGRARTIAAQGPPAAGQHASASTSRRGRVLDDGEAELEVAALRPWGEWDAERGGIEDLAGRRDPDRERSGPDEPLRRAPARVRLHAGGPPGPARADGARWPRSRPARWATTSPWRCSPSTRPVAVLVLQAALRPGDQPGDRPGARGDRDEPATGLGPREPARPDAAARPAQLVLEQPVLSERRGGGAPRRSTTAGCAPTSSTSPGGRRRARTAWRPRIERLCAEARGARRGRQRARPLRPRDRTERAADPVAARHLGGPPAPRADRRPRRAGLVVESGEPREVHHIAALIGYGASAINPYLMLDTVAEHAPTRRLDGLGRRDRRGGARSRRSARACSRCSRRWASRRSAPTAAPRSSRPSASTGPRRPPLHRHLVVDRRRRPRRARREALRATPAPTRAHGLARRARRGGAPPAAHESCCRRAASTRGAATASATCGTRRRSPRLQRAARGNGDGRGTTPSSPGA